jgi:5-methylcytosine-specific restriction endonuclease McrA
MAEAPLTTGSEEARGVDTAALSSRLAVWVCQLADADVTSLTEVEAIELISSAERLKRSLGAVQARAAAHVDEAARARQAEAGLRPERRGLGVGHQVALARRESPHRGSRSLGLAKALVHEMPQTLAAMTAGLIGEWQATLVARETAQLSREHRAVVDATVGHQLGEWGDSRIVRECRKLAQRLDAGAAVRRARQAETDRRVTIRPAPDCMTYVTALLPVAQGVATYAALKRGADSAASRGDERGRGQVMADTLVERVTGQAAAPGVPVEIGLVMTSAALLGDDDTPGHIEGHGPVPAVLGRDLVRDTRAAVWLRRLWEEHGALVSADARRRFFDGELRQLLVHRDQFCRQPWCDAPIRHADHVVPARSGTRTTLDNGQGLCEACNHAKEAPGWRARVASRAGPHVVEVTTPTGHRHRSRAPSPPGTKPPTRLEVRFRDLVLVA